MIFVLQVAVAVIFFAQKVLVLIGRKSGWLVGVLAAILSIFYFYLIGLLIYAVLEVGLTILMAYGFLKRSQSNPRVENAIRFSTALVLLALAYFAWSGRITILQLIGSFGMLVGTYLLTHGRIRTGWALGVAAHASAAWLGYDVGQLIFADFQVASAIVCAVGVTYPRDAAS